MKSALDSVVTGSQTLVKLLHEGERANPLVSIEHECGQLDVAIRDFWQNFPTSLRKTGNTLTIGLFPKDAKSLRATGWGTENSPLLDGAQLQ